MNEVSKGYIDDIEIKISPVKVIFITSKEKPSFRQLEASFGVPKSSIKDIADRENWELQREKYHRSIITDDEKRVMSKIKKERREKLNKINKVFNTGIDKLLDLIEAGTYVVSVRDLNILIRLTEFLEGNPEEIKEKRFVLDKPLSEYTLEELIAMKNKVIEGEATVIDSNEEEYADYEEIQDEEDVVKDEHQ